MEWPQPAASPSLVALCSSSVQIESIPCPTGHSSASTTDRRPTAHTPPPAPIPAPCPDGETQKAPELFRALGSRQEFGPAPRSGPARPKLLLLQQPQPRRSTRPQPAV